MKQWFSLIILFGSLSMASGQSATDCEQEHLKYVFKNFKVYNDLYKIEDFCDRQDILLVKMKTSKAGQKIYSYLSANDNQDFLARIKSIYTQLDIDCVNNQDSFEVIVQIIVEGCHEEQIETKRQLQDFKKLLQIDTDLIIKIISYRPHVCGSSGRWDTTKIISGYNGLAPLPMKPIKIELPKE